jgi:chitin synthase
MLILLILSFGNRPQGSSKLYYSLAAMMSINVLFVLGVGFYQIYLVLSKVGSWMEFWTEMGNQTTLRNIFISLVSSYGVFIISAIFYADPLHIFTSILQYLVLIPTWINIFMVYAFANLHDTSWGTKGAHSFLNQSLRSTPVLVGDVGQNSLNKINLETLEQQYRINKWELSKPEKDKRPDSDKRAKLDDYFR